MAIQANNGGNSKPSGQMPGRPCTVKTLSRRKAPVSPSSSSEARIISFIGRFPVALAFFAGAILCVEARADAPVRTSVTCTTSSKFVNNDEILRVEIRRNDEIVHGFFWTWEDRWSFGTDSVIRDQALAACLEALNQNSQYDEETQIAAAEQALITAKKKYNEANPSTYEIPPMPRGPKE